MITQSTETTIAFIFTVDEARAVARKLDDFALDALSTEFATVWSVQVALDAFLDGPGDGEND